ncbi:MAG: SDR family NAD(P)-dependent oxidoreductase [Acidobacteria bacterium]|nr:SDR family NAD(P)-dependent oxidoreductase [Acidobacteriaceae bacterium]MBV9609901.1 SDR family NAD(P)-dependent oxidoreductase [Acidobacteriota bacterium]
MGLATAKRFVLEGMDHVFITGRRKEVLEAAAAEMGQKVSGIPGDVVNLNELDRLYEVVKQYGRKLDVIFANAGVAQVAPTRPAMCQELSSSSMGVWRRSDPRSIGIPG